MTLSQWEKHSDAVHSNKALHGLQEGTREDDPIFRSGAVPLKHIVIAFCMVSVFSSVAAEASTSVYPGCVVPTLKGGHHTFYIDPVKGSPGGDGSAAKPWQTLAQVLAPTNTLLSTQGHKKVGGGDPLSPINPSGPIKAGDVIMLMSGNHGSVAIQNAFNSDFITVMSAPGQTPIISHMTIMSGAKWIFQGIKFQGQDPSANTATLSTRGNLDMVSLGRNEWQGTSSDIIFTDNSFSSADQVSKWSAADWLVRPYFMTLNIKTPPCVSVINNHFFNVLNAIYHGTRNVLIQDNIIEGYSNDAIETASSNTIIKGNTIKGNVSPSAINPWHPDGIQGWSLITNGVSAVNENVMIDGNTIIKTGDPSESWMQGISIFDGKWKNLTIQNNVVITNHWHGIAVYGAKGLRIVNNTVLASAPMKAQTWITVKPAKDGTPSQDVIVRNNISTNMVIGDLSATVDHNAVLKSYTVPVSGKVLSVGRSDPSTQMTVNPALNSQFVGFDVDKNEFDVRLKAASNLIGVGSAALAPPIDIAGKRRASPVDLGAYVK